MRYSQIIQMVWYPWKCHAKHVKYTLNYRYGRQKELDYYMSWVR